MKKSDLYIHSEKQFRKYEKALHEIITNYPKATHFDIKTESPNTFVCRLRDALVGFARNGWESELFSLEQCEGIFNVLKKDGTFVFRKQDGGVWVGPLEKHAFNVESVAKEVVVKCRRGELDAADRTLFDAVVVMKDRGLITEAIKFRNVTDDQVARLERNPHIEFFQPNDTDGLYIML